MQIRRTREAGRKLALILPVGPMGMCRWAVYFLREWGVNCSHVWSFYMDEWSDGEGRTLPPDNPGAFRFARENAFYGPLEGLTVRVDNGILPPVTCCRPILNASRRRRRMARNCTHLR